MAWARTRTASVCSWPRSAWARSAGAMALAMLGGGRPAIRALLAPALVLGLATASLAIITSFGLAAAVLVVVGFTGIFVMAGANTSHQLTVPDELRGRIMSLHMMVFAGMAPFGAFMVGSLAERFGIRTTLAVAGIAGIGLSRRDSRSGGACDVDRSSCATIDPPA